MASILVTIYSFHIRPHFLPITKYLLTVTCNMLRISMTKWHMSINSSERHLVIASTVYHSARLLNQLHPVHLVNIYTATCNPTQVYIGRVDFSHLACIFLKTRLCNTCLTSTLKLFHSLVPLDSTLFLCKEGTW